MGATDTGKARRAELLQRMTRTGLYLVTDDRLPTDILLTKLTASLEAGADAARDCLGQHRLADPGHVFDQHMPLAEQRQQDQLDFSMFSDDHALDVARGARNDFLYGGNLYQRDSPWSCTPALHERALVAWSCIFGADCPMADTTRQKYIPHGAGVFLRAARPRPYT